MSKILLTSDWHFGIRNSSKEWLEIQEDYFYNFFIPTAKEKNVETLIIAGDIFDNRQSLNVLVLHKVMNLFKSFSKTFKEIHIIAGNHDVFLKSSNEITSLDALVNISDNIFLYKEPEIVDIYGSKFFMMPWENDKIKEIEIIKSQNKFSDYLICHTEVKGFYYNSRVRVKEGNDLSVYKGYKKVFAGHFHYRQTSGDFHYLGSPMHLTRNDVDDRKGIYILDVSTNNLELIENDYSPEFIKLKLDDYLNISFNELKKLVNNNYIDVYTNDKFALKYNLNLLMRKLDNAKKIKVNIIELERKINNVVATENKKFSVIDLCNSYMDDNDFDDLEKNKISSYVEHIYNKIAI